MGIRERLVISCLIDLQVQLLYSTYSDTSSIGSISARELADIYLGLIEVEDTMGSLSFERGVWWVLSVRECWEIFWWWDSGILITITLAKVTKLRSRRLQPQRDAKTWWVAVIRKAAARRLSERMRIRELICRATEIEAKEPNHTLFQFFEVLSNGLNVHCANATS